MLTPTLVKMEGEPPAEALPLPEFENKEALNAWFTQHFGDTNNRTHSPSYFDQLPNPGPFWRSLIQARNETERDAVISRYDEDCLSQAPPIREQCWLMNRRFASAAIRTILDGMAEATATIYRDLNGYYARYLARDAECTDPAPILLYRRCCLTFREYMGEVGDDLTGILRGEVQTRLAVHPETAARLRDMLRRMKAESERRYGVANTRQDSTELLNGVKMFLRSGGDTEPPVPLTARNRMVDAGYLIVHGERPTIARAAVPGIHLISTAIMQLRSRNDAEIEGLLESFNNRQVETVNRPGCTPEERRVALILIQWKALWEAEALIVAQRNAGQGQGAFSQQSAGIDLLFSAFFWAVKCGVTDYDSFVRFNRFLYSLGLRSIGSRKMRAYLESTLNPFGQRILHAISDCTDVHLPPFVLSCARVSDMVAALGAFTIDDVRVNDVGRYAYSDRYILNLRRDENIGVAFLTLSWAMWNFSRRGNPGEGAICSAEHLLHQFLLRKISPFQNTHQMTGNALDVEVIDLGRDGGDLPDRQDPRPPQDLEPVGEDQPAVPPGAPGVPGPQQRIVVMDQRRRVLPGRRQTARTRELIQQAIAAGAVLRQVAQAPLPDAQPAAVAPGDRRQHRAVMPPARDLHD